MSLIARIFPGLAARSALATQATAHGVIPPARRESGPVSTAEAPAIPAVYRALSIVATAVTQLSLDVERQGQKLAAEQKPALIRRPNLDMSLSDFLEQTTLSLSATGNAYWLRHRAAGEVNELEPLNPHLVYPYRDRQNRRRFSYDGRTYTPADMEHLRLMTMPGADLGIGPIQAAQGTMRSARDLRDYSAGWFDDAPPSGALTSDDKLTADEAQLYRNSWNGLDADGNPLEQSDNPSRIKVLGRGLKYQPVMISPKDALWIDAQNFSVLEVARIFGVPSTLMLAAIDGNSMTYSNVEQEWLGFIRFSLMKYLRVIEEAFTTVTPRGQTIRFNIETLLRSDTTTRYRSYQTALDAGFLTVNEVREIENLPPLPGGDELPERKPVQEPAANSKEITA